MKLILRLFVILIVIMILLSIPTRVFAAPISQVDDPVLQCSTGVKLFDEGKYDEAIPLLIEGFNNRDQKAFPKIDDLGICALKLGNLLSASGKYAKTSNADLAASVSQSALDAYRVALDIFKLSKNQPYLVDTLNSIGQLYESQEMYTEALEAHQVSLSVVQEMGDKSRISIALNNIGIVYGLQKRHKEAIDVYQLALGMAQEAGDSAGEREILLNIGANYADLEQYNDALNYYQHGLTIAQREDNRISEMKIFYKLGAYNKILGRYTQALESYQKALSIARGAGDQVIKGNILNDIGAAYENQGKYPEALSYYQQGLAIAREVNNRPAEGTGLNNIGGVYFNQGRYGEAMDFYQRALIIRREVGDRIDEGITLDNIGLIYQAQGKYAEAMPYHQQALTIFRALSTQIDEGIALNNIGLAYHYQENYFEALNYYQQALVIARKLNDRANEGAILNNIARVYRLQRKYDDALTYYQQGLAIIREIRYRERESITLTNIGVVYNEKKMYSQALQYHQQALVIAQTVGNTMGEGEILSNIGGTYHSLSQYNKALKYYEQGMTIFEVLRQKAGSDESRASFISQYTFLYNQAIELYYKQSQPEKAFITSERGRARAFLDSMATGYVELSENEAAALYTQEQEIYAIRQAAQDTLLKTKSQNPPDEKLIADLEAQLVQAEKNHQAALDAIAARSDQLQQLIPGRSKVLDVSRAQALLDDQTTLLSFWVLDDQTLVFVLTLKTSNVVALPITQKDLYAQIQAFRAFSNIDSTYSESAVTLYKALIEPLKSQVTTPNLIIIPQGELHYLPFAALTDGSQYLIDQYNISYLPSVSALPFIRENIHANGGDALLVGNPAVGDAKLAPLPFAEKEVLGIAGLYGVNPFIGSAATESKLKEQAAQAGILHLAAHGSYNSVAPLYSSIALTPDGQNDGLLEVHEIYGLDLHKTNLVVLSACETQLGELSSGDELVGLTRAFFFAGTPTVIASLWSVNDEATSILMEKFYTHLRAGLGKADALRQAQIDVRANYPNPYYWAGFVLSGDGGKISDFNPIGSNFLNSPPSYILLAVCCFGLVLLIAVGSVWVRRRKRNSIR